MRAVPRNQKTCHQGSGHQGSGHQGNGHQIRWNLISDRPIM
jgi:hypothetical protein